MTDTLKTTVQLQTFMTK